MSTEVQFNLFNMEAQSLEGETTNEPTQIFKTPAPSMKLVQLIDAFKGPTENYVQFAELKEAHSAAKLSFLKKNLVEGDLLQIPSSYNGRRFIVFKSLEGTSFKGLLYEPDKVVEENNKKKQKKTSLTIELNEITLVSSKSLGDFVFNENPLNGLSYYVNPQLNIADFIAKLSDKEKVQFITTQLYFESKEGRNYSFDKISDLTREFEKHIELRTEPSYYNPRKYGLSDYCLSARRSYDKYKINFFGEEFETTIAELNKHYKVLIQSLKTDFQAKGPLVYNDFQLIAYYAIKGYILHFDIISNDWSIKHNFSDKLMYIDKNEALSPEKLLKKYNAFCCGSNKFLIENFTREDRSDTTAKYLTANSSLVPYKLPKNAVVKAPEEVLKLTSIKEYLVVSDDGKQVKLEPLGPICENANTKNVVIPRSLISSIKFPDVNKIYREVFVPFGIPVEDNNSDDCYLENNTKFVQQLSERELKQFVTFKFILEKGLFLTYSNISRAIFENDLDRVYKEIKNGYTNCSGSGGVVNEALTARFNHSGLQFNFALSDRSVELSLGLDEVVEVIREMYSAIKTFYRTELTLFELKWLYSFSENDLIYTGFNTHFVFNNKSIHSTKHNILTLA